MCPRWEMLVHINPVRRIAAYIEGQFKLLVGRDQYDVDGQSECEVVVFFHSFRLDM